MAEVFLVRMTELEELALEAAAKQFVDSERLKKTARLRQHDDRLRSLSCGLLLQYGVEHMHDINDTWPVSGWTFLTVKELLGGISQRRDFLYHYGRWGKPYITDGPYFSLSHSGEYAACAVSAEEVGLDIQKIREISCDRLAHRFFTEKEWKALLGCDEAERDRLFYRLWTRKEAYGKFTGRGLADSLGREIGDLERSAVTDRAEPEAVCFAEYDGLPGYQACLCLKDETGRAGTRQTGIRPGCTK